MKKTLFNLIALCACSYAHAQLLVDTSFTPYDIVTNTFLNNGIFVSNIQFSGSGEQVALFNSVNANVGIENGILMSTGSALGAVGPNFASAWTDGGGYSGATDPDLAAITNLPYNDACILEFDFIATGDSMQFVYVFASEEYPEYSGADADQDGNPDCGNVSDAFAFFVSGPGINGPFSNNAENIARIPGTSEMVSIFTLNGGCDGYAIAGEPDCNNCGYFVHNGIGYEEPYDGSDYYIQADGFTLPMIASIGQLQYGEVYHIKLVVADALDTAYDSYVFLQGGGFSQFCTEGNGNLMPTECLLCQLDALVEPTETCGEVEVTNISEINLLTTDCHFLMGNGDVIYEVEGFTYQYAEPGTYELTIVYEYNGFVSYYNFDTIEVTLLPPATPVIIQEGNVLSLSNWDGVSDIQWYLDGALLIDAISPAFEIAETGVYTVTANNGCGAMSAEFQAEFTLTDELASTVVQIYPNPSSGRVTLNFPNNAIEWKLWDTHGQLIRTSTVAGVNSIELELSKGVYMVGIESGKGSMTYRKIVVF